MHLKIGHWDGVESLTTLEEGEFKLAIDSCIEHKHVDKQRDYDKVMWHRLTRQMYEHDA